jgi:hypothetical protein
VPSDKAALTAAPHHDPDAAISADDEAELYRTTASPPVGPPPQSTLRAPASARDLTGELGVQGRDTSGSSTDSAMTRSEELFELHTEHDRPARPPTRHGTASRRVLIPLQL